MKDNLSDSEKLKLGQEAITAWLEKFQPFDKTTAMFMVVVLEMLYNSKKPTAYYDEFSGEYKVIK